MKPADRHRTILDLVRNRDTSVEALGAALNVSEATVRRDLALLAGQRLLVRTHGGTTALVGIHEPEATLEQRKASRSDEKRAIAKAAAAYIQPGDTLFLDSGTACAALAAHLCGHEIRKGR